MLHLRLDSAKSISVIHAVKNGEAFENLGVEAKMSAKEW